MSDLQLAVATLLQRLLCIKHSAWEDSSQMRFVDLQIDQDTNDLLRSLNMVNLPGVKMVAVSLLYTCWPRMAAVLASSAVRASRSKKWKNC